MRRQHAKHDRVYSRADKKIAGTVQIAGPRDDLDLTSLPIIESEHPDGARRIEDILLAFDVID
jgi:hypothetical protein